VNKGVGIVVIGRNEGERLQRCLDSVRGATEGVVYVDSGSTDGSVARARECGALVVELNPGVAFSAARARNAGLRTLVRRFPHISFVQFLDGDCELQAGWVEAASQFLAEHKTFAVVCGRRRERWPQRSIYNRLMDVEWNTPIGEAEACGGDLMVRIDAFLAVEGFREDLICGEEPELCRRLRTRGFRIMRLDQEMTLHDAAMVRLSQWWRRQVRSGYGYAEMAFRHGRERDRFRVRETASIVSWAAFLPALAIFTVFRFGWAGLAPLSLYLVLGLRIYVGRLRRGQRDNAALYSVACCVGKVPQFQGVVSFFWTAMVLGQSRPLIEYKR